MAFQEQSTMTLRAEFIALAQQPGANVRALCRRYQISPTTGYKWRGRVTASGPAGLANQSRRPHHSPNRTTAAVEAAVLAVRDVHPAWGALKIRAWLTAQGQPNLPSVRTITSILGRHGRIDPQRSAQARPYQRFEHAEPNQLWQMDFKGHVALRAGRCHPLTVLDDHSRFVLGLAACADERTTTVQGRLTAIFRRYGVPERLLCDNGPPWGSGAAHGHTPLTVWLLRVGVRVSHGRPYHPQTQGKDERFHRTLKAELLNQPLRDLAHAQDRFDAWRDLYNLERPHQALDLAVPASRYRPSARPFPETLPPLTYGPDDLVRRVQDTGLITLRGRRSFVGQAFRGLPVALRPTAIDDELAVFFAHQRIAQLDLTTPQDA